MAALVTEATVHLLFSELVEDLQADNVTPFQSIRNKCWRAASKEDFRTVNRHRMAIQKFKAFICPFIQPPRQHIVNPNELPLQEGSRPPLVMLHYTAGVMQRRHQTGLQQEVCIRHTCDPQVGTVTPLSAVQGEGPPANGEAVQGHVPDPLQLWQGLYIEETRRRLETRLREHWDMPAREGLWRSWW